LRVEEAQELPATGSIGRLAFVVHVRNSGGLKGEGVQREAGILQEGTTGEYRRMPWRKPPEWAGRIGQWRIYEIEREYRRVSGEWRLFTSH
jgi:hypothetical protein